MRILHLGIDSHFVDFLVTRFERVAPGVNELIEVGGTGPSVRAREFTGPTSWVPAYAPQVEEVLERAAAVDVLVVHGMSDFAALVCAQLPPGVRLVWSGFGYDYYVGESGADLLGERTLALVKHLNNGRLPDNSGRLVRAGDEVRLEPVALDVVRRVAAQRTDYFSAPSPADLAVFTRAFGGFGGSYHQLNYGDVASMCRSGDAVVSGDDVLLGNSASWANNHLEAIKVLAKTDLGSRRVVVPLTYGDPAYRDVVITVGRDKLGEHFHPLVDHLPIEDYLAVLAGCGTTLFQHRRQQGLGNIVAALQQGSHLYLSRQNPLFRWLRSHDVAVRPPSSLRESGLPHGPVPAEQLARHRAFVARTWGADQVDANVRALVRAIEERVSASGPPAPRPRGIRARLSR